MRDPDARNGKMWASCAAAGRSGRFRLHVCVDWMVPLSGSWAVMPGIAVRLFVNGALVVTKWSRLCRGQPGMLAGRKHNLFRFEVVLVSLAWYYNKSR